MQAVPEQTSGSFDAAYISVLHLHDCPARLYYCTSVDTRSNKAMARMIPGLSDSAICGCVCLCILDHAAELTSIMRGIPVVKTDLPAEGIQ